MIGARGQSRLIPLQVASQECCGSRLWSHALKSLNPDKQEAVSPAVRFLSHFFVRSEA